jgi:hypothetical protein
MIVSQLFCIIFYGKTVGKRHAQEHKKDNAKFKCMHIVEEALGKANCWPMQLNYFTQQLFYGAEHFDLIKLNILFSSAVFREMHAKSQNI